MHIEGVNLLSLLPGNNTTEGGTQSLSEHGVIPGDFSNALMGQIGLLREANGQVELPVQLQSMVMSQTIDNLHDIGDLLKQQIKLLNETSSQVELPEQLQTMTMPQTIDNLHDIGDLLKQQIKLLDEANSQVKLPEQLQTMTIPQATDNLYDIGDLQKHEGNEEELAALLDDYLPLSYEKREIVDPNEDTGLEATLLALTETLKSITPGISPDEVAAAQNMNDVMSFNGLSFVKPLPEEAKLNKLGAEDVSSGDFLQKETVLRRSIQDEQGFNLQFLKNTEDTEKTRGLEKQAFISGIEKTTPGVVADMVPLHRLVDNRADSPAITRPLTHPDWSKDLGDQIVWMNNKAIPAAEIKLNPAHLGPISVRIDVNQDQATILFTAQHAEVKEAIEASIPKLREMLGTQQLNLVNVNISQNSTSDQGRSQSQTFSKKSENHEQGIDSITDTLEKTEPDRSVSKGLLSIYA
jgi:flagellar hook-length control protein FliK